MNHIKKFWCFWVRPHLLCYTKHHNDIPEFTMCHSCWFEWHQMERQIMGEKNIIYTMQAFINWEKKLHTSLWSNYLSWTYIRCSYYVQDFGAWPLHSFSLAGWMRTQLKYWCGSSREKKTYSYLNKEREKRESSSEFTKTCPLNFPVYMQL